MPMEMTPWHFFLGGNHLKSPFVSFFRMA